MPKAVDNNIFIVQIFRFAERRYYKRKFI